MNIDEIRALTIKEIEIPGSDDGEKIKIKVQKPHILALAAQGKIPNALMGLATRMVRGQKKEQSEATVQETGQTFELYCRACMVEPTYDEMKDIINDEQMLAIFDWAMGGTKKLEPFRTEKENGTDNNDGQGVPEETK